jgi:uncharacterized NAD(P)/FAD-binding protein YdhS
MNEHNANHEKLVQRFRYRGFTNKIATKFTAHPESAGETYTEHLGFTLKMAARFAFISGAITVHGLFPFLCTTTASRQVEQIYRIIKTRIPKKRLEEIDRESMKPIRIHASSGDIRVAIIGGGFSGALVLANLVRLTDGALTIDWFEPSGRFGTGVAYGTTDNVHRLNVRADRMGAFAKAPDGFYHWLQTEAGQDALHRLWPGNDVAPDSYVPRVVYGAYIQAIVADAMEAARTKDIRIHCYPVAVDDIVLKGDTTHQLQLQFESEDTRHQLTVDAAVLATGNLPPRSHGFQRGLVTDKINYIDDVWNAPKGHLFPEHVGELSPDTDIVIVGTGLTMVDTVLTLRQHGYKGKMTAISRSGLIPAAHRNVKPYPAWEWVHSPIYAPRTAFGLLVRLRQEIRKAEAEGYSWHSVIDSLRPVTQTLWRQLETQEKRRFLRRLATFWNVHRHRMAASLHQTLRDLQQSATLTILAGKIYYIGSDKDGLTVAYRKRGTNRVETLRPALVLNCTGPEVDIAASDHDLLKRLRDRELITVGPLRAGIEMTEHGTAKGKAADALFPIGTLLVGELLECTAVLELRQQAAQVAGDVLRRVNSLHDPAERAMHYRGAGI